MYLWHTKAIFGYIPQEAHMCPCRHVRECFSQFILSNKIKMGHIKYKGTERLKVKPWDNIYHLNSKHIN